MTNRHELDVFISGECIDLCIPTENFALRSDWYSWFNDPDITRYLDQGMFPNNPRQQKEYFNSEKDRRVILVISDKSQYLGVVSLTDIDFRQKKATLTLVINYKKNVLSTPYIGLEAIARMTEHAFTGMGLNRVESMQHIGLRGWQHRKELFGFRLEGVKRKGVIKGHDDPDVLCSAVLLEDYQKIVKIRGSYWDSISNIKLRLRAMKTRSLLDDYLEFRESVVTPYYEEIFRL